MTPYTVEFPEYFDDYVGEIEAKGYFADLVINADGLQYRPVFYDVTRFRQEYQDRLASGAAAFSERNVVVMNSITRAHIRAAVDELARAGFHALMPESTQQRPPPSQPPR